jgi:uncharacterized protein YuzE
MFDVSYDPVADAVYVKLESDIRAKRTRTRRLDSNRLVDLAADGRVLGVELLWVSEGVDLRGIPQAGDIADALTARGILVRHRPPVAANLSGNA